MANVSFDPINRLINVTVAPTIIEGEPTIFLDFKTDFYSQGKHDWISDESLRKLDFPIRPTGGDDLPGSKQLGSTFFLASDWKVQPYEGDHRFLLNGNVYSEDGTSPFNGTIGNFNVFFELTVSSLVDSTVAQLDEIEQGMFGGVVTIDENNITGLAKSGSDYPAGTPLQPCLLQSDLHIVALARGLNKVHVLGNIELNDTASWDGHEFVGESSLKTTITIPSIASVLNCEFYDATITGTLDGNSQIERAVISGLDFVDGYIFECAIGPDVIKLGTSTIANIFNCFSTVPGTDTPEIDMNGTGILALRNYNGGMLLKNYNGSEAHSIDLNSGQLKLDATITSGTFVVRGTGKLIDTSGNQIFSGTWNGGVTIVNELLNTSTISTNIVDKVYIDTEALINGNGSPGSPFDNIGDGIDYAEDHNIRQLVIYAEVILDRNLKNFTVIGIGAPVVDCNGQDLTKSEFSHCTMRGDYIGSIVVQESVLDNNFHLNGFFEKCGLVGALTCNDGSSVLVANCFSLIAGLNGVTVSMNGAGSSNLSIRNYSGGLTILDCNNVNDAITVEMSQGKLTLDSTCTDGIISVRGVSYFVDNSNGSSVDITALVENLIWDKTLP